MRLLKPLLIAGFLLMTGHFAGCSREPPRMKNQPTSRDSGESQIEWSGKKKSFNVAK